MAAPIYQGNKLIGILAVRLPNEQINTILSEDNRSLRERFG